MRLLISDRIPDFDNFGTNSLISFRRACIEGIDADLENAAFYRLLADHAEHLIDAYHQVPLDTSVASRDFEHFTKLVNIASDAIGKSSDHRLAMINEIAAAKFF